MDLDDTNVPTSAKGVLGEKGDILFLRHANLSELRLVAVTGTVKCSIRIGICEREESSAIATGSVDVTLETGDIQIGAVEIKDDDSDTRVSVEADLSKNAMFVQEETRNDMEGGGQVSIGTTAVEMTFTGTPKSIVLRADNSNTDFLYVGESNVTNTGANALTFLGSGDSMTIEYDDTTNAVYVVSGSASQNVWSGAIL